MTAELPEGTNNRADDFVAMMRREEDIERLDDIERGLLQLRRDYMSKVAEVDCYLEVVRKARTVVS